MREIASYLFFPLIPCFGLLCCGNPLARPASPAKWTTGFWYWNGSSAAVTASVDPIDVIFCQAGTIRNDSVYGQLPEHLPSARDYWLVFRFDSPGVPGLATVPKLTATIAELRETARRRRLNVAGIQLDVDSPTRTLPQYAAFLREVRKELPPELPVSITALLDWFRAGTAIDQVLKEVDEFVPQFYDVQDANDYRGGTAIAKRLDAARWGPVFNRYRKRFRIGVSTFGRSRLIPRGDSASSELSTFVDLKPLDIALDPAFHLETSKTAAEETVLNYRATRATRIGYTDFEPGDAIQFVISTREGIGAAVEQARRIHGYCAGVVFFRWPTFDETLDVLPDDVLSAAGVLTPPHPKPALRVVPGDCAAVNCADLYLVDSILSPQATPYQIDSSIELAYFLPFEKVPIRMSGSSRLELSLPPYCGQSRMYLGRAVTAKRAEFTMTEGR